VSFPSACVHARAPSPRTEQRLILSDPAGLIASAAAHTFGDVKSGLRRLFGRAAPQGTGLSHGGGSIFAAVSIALFYFAALAPTLMWPEFQNAIECGAVATGLEVRRTGHWLIPTLNGVPRTRKPPLPAWICATAIQPGTVAAMSDSSPQVREAAYRKFTWEARWPTLLATCLTLLATFDLGRVVANPRVGIVAALAAGSNVLLLVHGRLTGPDAYLTLWAVTTNAFLARGILLRQWWLAAIGGGIALGLALLAKGPVALLETVVPAAAMLGWWLLSGRRPSELPGSSALVEESDVRQISSPPWRAVGAGLVITLAISLPWFVLMTTKVSGVGRIWFNEITRVDPADPNPDPWYQSAAMVWMLYPWTLWLLIGLGSGAVAFWKRRSPGEALVFLLTALPLLTMAFFPERKERYRLPLVAPAMVLVALAVERCLLRPARDAADPDSARHASWRRLALGSHWALLGVGMISLPLSAATLLHRGDGRPWLSYPAALLATAAALALLAICILYPRRGPIAMAAITFVVVLAFDTAYRAGIHAAGTSSSNMKPLAALIWSRSPEARVYTTGGERVEAPADLAIYLNREVVVISDPAQEIHPARVPQVLIFFQSKGEPPPPTPGRPTGLSDAEPSWQKIGVARRGRNLCHAFLLAAFPDSTTSGHASGETPRNVP